MRLILCIFLMLSAGMVTANPAALQAVNEMRSAKGLPPVSYSGKLQKAAQAHADDMARKGFFSHTGSNGSDVGKRARKAGYRWCRISENIAKGQRGVGKVMAAWKGSPSHYTNIVRPGTREIGIAEGPGSIWVLVMGARKC